MKVIILSRFLDANTDVLIQILQRTQCWCCMLSESIITSEVVADVNRQWKGTIRSRTGTHKRNGLATLIGPEIIIIIFPLTSRVVWAPQMISQPVSSIFLYSPLLSGTRRTPGLSIPWCCFPTCSSVCLFFFPLSLCLARRFLPDLMNGKDDHTTAVCVSLQWSGDLRVIRLPAGSWHGLPRW